MTARAELPEKIEEAITNYAIAMCDPHPTHDAEMKEKLRAAIREALDEARHEAASFVEHRRQELDADELAAVRLAGRLGENQAICDFIKSLPEPLSEKILWTWLDGERNRLRREADKGGDA